MVVVARLTVGGDYFFSGFTHAEKYTFPSAKSSPGLITFFNLNIVAQQPILQRILVFK